MKSLAVAITYLVLSVFPVSATAQSPDPDRMILVNEGRIDGLFGPRPDDTLDATEARLGPDLRFHAEYRDVLVYSVNRELPTRARASGRLYFSKSDGRLYRIDMVLRDFARHLRFPARIEAEQRAATSTFHEIVRGFTALPGIVPREDADPAPIGERKEFSSANGEITVSLSMMADAVGIDWRTGRPGKPGADALTPDRFQRDIYTDHVAEIESVIERVTDLGGPYKDWAGVYQWMPSMVDCGADLAHAVRPESNQRTTALNGDGRAVVWIENGMLNVRHFSFIGAPAYSHPISTDEGPIDIWPFRSEAPEGFSGRSLLVSESDGGTMRYVLGDDGIIHWANIQANGVLVAQRCRGL